MKQNLQFKIIIGLLLINHAVHSQQSSQVFLESYGATGTQEMFYKTSVLRGTDGYNYVCGATLNSGGNYDMLLTKMTGHNVVVWTQQYAGAAGGDDFAADLVQDGAGNIIITGAEYISATNYNAVTIKYNSAGVQQWLKSYNGAANSFDGGISVVRDASNNIYMCGGSYGTTTFSDFLCVKYNSNGVQQWATTWNGVGMQDVSARLAVSATQVSVIGASQQTANDWKMATTFFNVNTGAFLGVKLTGGDDEGIDKVVDLAIDASDNTYVVGAVRNINKAYDIKVIKLSPTYTVLWQQTFNGTANLNDEGLSLELTSTNDVVVCGFTTTTEENKNFITRKYAGSSGALLWSKTFDEQDGEDKATDLKLDLSGNAIICGSSYKDGNLDYVVQKLKNTTGDIIWTGRWNGDSNLNDQPMNLAIDENDNTVYVAGQSEVMANKFKYYVTRWSQKDLYMPKPSDGFSTSGGYIQNREQLRNEDGTANSSVKYYCQKNSPSTYIDDSKISYIFSSPKSDTLPDDTLHRVDMIFKKGIENAKVYPVSERPEYANYYLGHMTGKAERTSISNAVVKLGAYINTDIIFSNNSSGYRHWIVARSGAPTGLFQMEYNGQSSLSVNGNGDLVLGTSVGDQLQPKAKVYTMNNTTGVLTLLAWQPDYVVSGNQVSFNYTGSWSGTLVIEMQHAAAGGGTLIESLELEWSTYFGGSDIDFLTDVTGDAAGRTWVVGATRSIGFPEVPGTSMLNENAGAYDYSTAAFAPNCAVMWFSYYGGSNDDRTNGITRTTEGNIVVVGWTQSTDLPDVADGALDDDIIGGFTDGLIIKMTPNGFVMLDSYIGGDENDYIMDVAFNQNTTNKDLYLVGHTKSDETTFPVASPSGAYVQDYAGTSGGITETGDGFLMRINELNNTIVWSTFFGTDTPDKCLDIAFAANDVFIVGTTKSNSYSADECSTPTDGNFPHCVSAGSWGNNNFGEVDMQKYVITRFDRSTNALKWSTILSPATGNLGTVLYSELGIGSASPTSSDIYVCGGLQAQDVADFPFITSSNSGSYNQTEDLDFSAFLFRFRLTNELNIASWSTGIGGVGMQTGSSVSVSQDGTVYLTGFGGMPQLQNVADWCTVPAAGDDGFPMCNASGNSYMETNIDDTWWRATISAFDQNDHMIWSTQFGNVSQNYSYNSACVGDYVYICGSADFPISELPEDATWTLQQYDELATTDYYQSTHGGEDDGTITRLHRTQIVAIEEVHSSNNEGLQVYPVPTDGMLQVILPSWLNSEGNFNVINSVGQIVFTTRITSNNMIMDLSHLANGCYTIQASSNSAVLTGSFIKN
jgi:hypothetical protein